MSGKDWFDDFMDYKLSGCEETNESSDNGGCMSVVLGVLAVLGVISWIL